MEELNEKQKHFEQGMFCGLIIGSIVVGLFTFVVTKGIYHKPQKIHQNSLQHKIDSIDNETLNLKILIRKKEYNKLLEEYKNKQLWN